jgi:hypothetical protein
MNRRIVLAAAGMALMSMTGTGCSSTVASLTMVSTKNVDLSAPHERLPRASENDDRFWLLFIPLGGEPSGVQAATKLLEDASADYLTNVEIREGGWSILAISRGWVEVEADPMRRNP